MKTTPATHRSQLRPVGRRTGPRARDRGAVLATQVRPLFWPIAPGNGPLSPYGKDPWTIATPLAKPGLTATVLRRPDFDLKLEVGTDGLRCVHTTLGVPPRSRLRGGLNGEGRFDPDWEGNGFLDKTDLKLSAHFHPGGWIRLEGRALHPERPLVVRFLTPDDRLLGVHEALVDARTPRVWVSVCDGTSGGSTVVRCVVAIERLLSGKPAGDSRPPPYPKALLDLADLSWKAYRLGTLDWTECAGLVCAHGSPIEAVARRIEACAGTDDSVLILGSTGAGKSKLGRWLHEKSGRSAGPFFQFSAGDFAAGDPLAMLAKFLGFGPNSGYPGIPYKGQDGVLKRADGGSLFLDELPALPKEGQTALLLVLDGQPFHPAAGEPIQIRTDVRFIFAMNCGLQDAIDAGVFRDDFAHRIRMQQVSLPPLTDRRGDIPALIGYFLADARNRISLEEDLFKAMVTYGWPGNVRQLKGFLKALDDCRSTHRFNLENLDQTLVDPGLLDGLRAAYAAYQGSQQARRLAPREASVVTMLAEQAANLFRQALGQERHNPQWDWRQLVKHRLAECRENLIGNLGLKDARLSPGTDCYDLLRTAYKSIDPDPDTVARRLLAHVLRRLQKEKVELSNHLERPRYATFRAFMGLDHHRVIYVAKEVDQPPG